MDGFHGGFFFFFFYLFISFNHRSQQLILLPIITEIMEDKVIETITYIKLVSKKKPSIDRIKTHLKLAMKMCGQ